MPHDALARLKSKLNEQLTFLQEDCEKFDQGAKNYGVRLAGVIRTIFGGDTKNPSLVALLGAETVSLLSTGGRPPVNGVIDSRTHFFTLCTPNGNGSLRPLEGKAGGNFMAAPEWLNEVVYVIVGTEYSRWFVVKNAADKDGGAHVDRTLPPQYRKLAEPGSLGVLAQIKSKKVIGVSPIEDAHLCALRQMAYELLNSPELKKLTE